MKIYSILILLGTLVMVSALSARDCGCHRHVHHESGWACGYSAPKDIRWGKRLKRDDATSPFPSTMYPFYNHTGGNNPANNFYPGDCSKGYRQGFMTRIEQINSPLVVDGKTWPGC